MESIANMPRVSTSDQVDPPSSHMPTASFAADVDQQDAIEGMPERPELSLLRMSSLDRLLAYQRALAAFESSTSEQTRGQQGTLHNPISSTGFRSIIAEVAFCSAIAMTQLLSEVHISGFALVLVKLLKDIPGEEQSSTGSFWPAAILSLVISATLLVWARVADLWGGYHPMMFSLLWLTVWSTVPGLASSLVILNISRAMQGLAIAALMPSVFVLLGHIYEDGHRKNIVMGIYSACAPIGFGIAGLLSEHTKWFFFITAILSFNAAVTAYLSTPQDHTDRRKMDLKMDWLGAFCIISGLMLVGYALAVEPKQAKSEGSSTAFHRPAVLAPLVLGILALGTAVWVEGWYATCPLLPFDVFRARGVKSLCVACLFFYGTFGVWIYNTSEYFNIPAVSGQSTPVAGMQLVIWYLPLVVSGILFCVVGSSLAKWIELKFLVIISGLAWIGAPLVLALAPTPLYYWSEILPSMICASLGTDLTFTISNMFLAASQPQEYQGTAGAVSSILFNLGVSLSLPIAQIVYGTAQQGADVVAPDASGAQADIDAYRKVFFYATASATLGLLICIFCFRPGLVSEVSSLKTKDSRSSSTSEIREQ